MVLRENDGFVLAVMLLAREVKAAPVKSTTVSDHDISIEVQIIALLAAIIVWQIDNLVTLLIRTL